MFPRNKQICFHGYPQSAQGAIWDLVRNVGMAPELACSVALSEMAAAVQGLFDVEPLPGMILPTSLIVKVTAPSGSGKTVAEDRLGEGRKRFETKMRQCFDSQNIEYRSKQDVYIAKRKALLRLIKQAAAADDEAVELSEKLIELDKSAPKKPRLVTLTVKDATVAGILNKMHRHWPNTYASYDEGADFVDQRLSEFIGTINSSWCGSSLSVNTANREICIESPRISWLIQIQPGANERFENKLGSRAADEGLNARSLMCMVEPVMNPNTVASSFQCWDGMDKFTDACYRLLKQTVGPDGEPVERQRLKFDHEAQTQWDQERIRVRAMKAPGGTLQHLPEMCAKAPDLLARIAAIFHVFDGCQGDILLSTLRKAMAVFEWYADEQIRMFTKEPEPAQELIDGQLLMRWFANYVRIHNSLSLPKNYLLKNGPRATRTASRLNAALIALWQQGVLLEHVPPPESDSKAVIIVLNAYCFQQHQIFQLCGRNPGFPK